MRGVPTTFWGKLRQRADGSVLEWHPLVDHCADVAAVTNALLQLPVWQRRLAKLAGRELDTPDLARLCVLAALHDLGKLNLGFQAKGRPDLGATAGHVEEAVAAVTRDALPSLNCLSGWGDSVGLLLLSAICHHGRPHTINSTATRLQASWWKARDGLDPRVGCELIVERCRRWYPQAFDGGQPLPDRVAFGHTFAGIVMLADWIGSDTRFFRFSEKDEDRMPFARAQALEAITALGLDVPLETRTDTADRHPFARVAPKGFAARPAQIAIVGLPMAGGGTLTILEAETGSGKTEAALARFVQVFEAGLVDGLYFALPTRSAATQMHARVVAAVRRAFSSPPAVVLAVPGYLRVDDVDAQERLAPFDVLWPDHERFRYRGWAAENPKRFLVGTIVIGTIDQVLLSSLMVKHAHLRASALLRHLLVVDEVHASDVYMERILQDVLARHLGAGGHALLLSATLGAEARGRLLRPGERLGAPPLEEAVAAPYPLLTHRSIGVETIALRAGDNSRTIRVIPEAWLETVDLVAGRALAAAVDGAKVLVIRNTVADCIATQESLERLAVKRARSDLLFSCSGAPAPHHARFARLDREALDRALEGRLGKERPQGGCVVVATQTVQQSLDLDADLLITDLCPADVLLQRFGRLHRHPRDRPVLHQTPTAVVVLPAKRDLSILIGERGVARSYHGLGGVYPDLRIIEATWRLIEEHPEWRVPEMNRLLVERSLHSTVLAAIVESGAPRWREHATQVTGAVLGQARQAQLNLVDWARPYGDSSFPDAADQRIQTRLGQGDRLVHFAPPAHGPFGSPVSELVLPAWWVGDVAGELDAAESVTQHEGTVRFEFGPHSFIYDRLGLRRLPRR